MSYYTEKERDLMKNQELLNEVNSRLLNDRKSLDRGSLVHLEVAKAKLEKYLVNRPNWS